LTLRWNPPFWIGDRLFSQEDLDLIHWTAKRYSNLSRTELAYTICENLDWRAPNGKERLHGCLDLLEKLATDGVLKLPGIRKLAPYKKSSPSTMALPQLNVTEALSALRPVTVELVPSEEQSLWDATMAEHHPFGFERAFGAHQRYWIYGRVGGKKAVVGAFLFATPARNVAVRDAWLGWTQQQQQRFRYRIVSKPLHRYHSRTDYPGHRTVPFHPGRVLKRRAEYYTSPFPASKKGTNFWDDVLVGTDCISVLG